MTKSAGAIHEVRTLTECAVSSATTIAQTAGDEERGGELDGEV